MAEYLREQYACYYDEDQRIPRRRSATRQDLEARRTGNARPTCTPNTADDDVLDERPGRLPTSTRRYTLPAPEREYMIPLTDGTAVYRSEEHTSELQSQSNLVCRLLLEKKKT